MHDDHEEYLTTILELFRNEPRGMSISDISREIGLNRNSVSKYVNMLTIAGKVEMKAVGPAKVYFLSERVPISAMIEFSSDAIVLLDDQLRIVNANDQYLSLTEAAKQDILGEKIQGSTLPILSTDLFLSSIPKFREREQRIPDYIQTIGGEERSFTIKILPAAFEGGNAGYAVIIEETTERRAAEETIRSALSEKEALLSELHLRIKNNLQLIASLINLQMMESSDDHVNAALRETQNRIISLSIVHEHLYARSMIAEVDIGEYLTLLISELGRSFELPAGAITLSVMDEGIHLSTDRAIALGLITNELITIGIGSEGRPEIRIAISRSGDEHILSILAGAGHHKPEGLSINIVRRLVKRELQGEFEIIPDGWEVRFP
ncbi:hypothetical protein RJ53_05890 [Methanocalculus chunghsingensis]|uniref:histidine kinase n=2 Tax=Methanocalculus chunghsingensis TaxID=156457 RepID=A0A8J8B4T6_9EURY|nr:hypothetical protein [Methanocalculus chunghsingensis]